MKYMLGYSSISYCPMNKLYQPLMCIVMSNINK